MIAFGQRPAAIARQRPARAEPLPAPSRKFVNVLASDQIAVGRGPHGSQQIRRRLVGNIHRLRPAPVRPAAQGESLHTPGGNHPASSFPARWPTLAVVNAQSAAQRPAARIASTMPRFVFVAYDAPRRRHGVAHRAAHARACCRFHRRPNRHRADRKISERQIFKIRTAMHIAHLWRGRFQQAGQCRTLADGQRITVADCS